MIMDKINLFKQTAEHTNIGETMPQQAAQPNFQQSAQTPTKFCKFCAGTIPIDAVLCTHCGRQVEEMHGANAVQPQIVINNSNQNANTNSNTNINGNFRATYRGKRKNKWVAFWLCVFFGCFGAHKFYEGKTGAGILYIFTVGLFCFGWIGDCIALLAKPNPYYV